MSNVYSAPLNTSGKDRVTVEVLTSADSEDPAFSESIDIDIQDVSGIQDSLSDYPGAGSSDMAILRPDRIALTERPPNDSKGGPDSRAAIAGTIAGDHRGLKVLIYACTTSCFVQPLIADPLTEIRPDGTWENWTHTGWRYLVFLVPKSFQPRPVLANPFEKVQGAVAELRFDGK